MCCSGEVELVVFPCDIVNISFQSKGPRPYSPFLHVRGELPLQPESRLLCSPERQIELESTFEDNDCGIAMPPPCPLLFVCRYAATRMQRWQIAKLVPRQLLQVRGPQNVVANQ